MHSLIQRRTIVIAGASAAGALFLFGHAQKKPELPVPEVGVAAAKALIDAGALVIDVRGKDPYDYRHLPGAMWISLAQLSAGIPASLIEAKAKSIVVYCNDGVATGPKGTRILLDHGFANAVNLTSGVEGWDAAGLPMVRGKAA